MKIKILFVFIVLTAIIVFSGCGTSIKVADNSLKVTEDDEKLILEYLDNNTDDLATAQNGKMYSAFKLLGTNQSKIFLWVTKIEFKIKGGKITSEQTQGVSTPLVLNVKKNGNSLSILSHQFPEEGEKYGKSIKKLFPPDMVFPYDNVDVRQEIDESIKARVEKDINKVP